MSQITFAPKFMTFQEWIKANPDAELQEEECDVCEGTGMSECFHCGSEMECDKCDGTGKIRTAKDAYNYQLRRDKMVLKKYRDWLERAAQLCVETESGGTQVDHQDNEPATEVENGK